jgi:D-serine deaminase-like pyridoxal phosphate-dependent protein
MASFLSYDELKQCLQGRSLPAAFVDLNALDHNIAEVVRRAKGRKIRIATKSIRCVEVLRRILGSHPSFIGLMAYSPWEAVALSRAGFDDILLGYPVADRDGLAAIAAEVAQGKRITLMVDHAAHLDLANEAAQLAGAKLPVCIDMDLSSDFGSLHFGVYRSPLRTPQAVAQLAQLAQRQPNLAWVGLMGYEAQLSGVPDRSPAGGIKNILIRQLKRRSRKKVAAQWATLRTLLPEWGQLQFVNGGGTGSLEFTTTLPEITEITAGSAFYAPPLFDHYDTFRQQPAAGFALAVTRIPAPGIVTCSGGGYIASGPASEEKLPKPWLPQGLKLLAHEGAGEVQTPLRGEAAAQLQIGAAVAFRHAKAGEFCERFDSLLLLRNGKIEGDAKTYRGEGWNFG